MNEVYALLVDGYEKYFGIFRFSRLLHLEERRAERRPLVAENVKSQNYSCLQLYIHIQQRGLKVQSTSLEWSGVLT